MWWARPLLTSADNAASDPDRIGMDGVMQYFEAIGVAIDDVSFAVTFDLVDAPSMGEFSREGFVTGWTNASTPSNPCDTTDRQKAHIQSLVHKLGSDPSYFKQVYKSSFKYAKPEDKRAVPVEDAFAFWDVFFGGSKGGINWSSPGTKWYELWREYYTSKNNRPVNKDLWNQVAELVNKTREAGGEKLEWWSEDGAWPTAVDDFVAFVKEKRGPEAVGGGMDTS